MSSDGADVHNQATGGHNVVQANTISGGVHFHAGASGVDDPSPLVSVSRSPDVEAVVQGDPPRIMPLSHGETIEVLVEAPSAQAIVLRALRPVVLARRPPRPAFVQRFYTGHLQPRRFTVDLDSGSGALAPDGVDFPFTVSAADPELFRLQPRVTGHEVSWQLELDWTCAGRHGRVVINDAGRPFQLYPEGQSMISTRQAASARLFDATVRAARRAEVVDYWREELGVRTDFDDAFRHDLQAAADELEGVVRRQANGTCTGDEANQDATRILSQLFAGDPRRREFLDSRASLDRTSELLDGGVPKLRWVLYRKSG